jgi:hypothetical protein
MTSLPDCYAPIAVYYEDADSLEYVRRDEPSVYRRIDELLTLVLSLETREVIGFRLKGFNNFYLRYLKSKYHLRDDQFPMLVNLMQDALSLLGDAVFSQRERRAAYEKALSIAAEDSVELRELPKAAAG